MPKGIPHLALILAAAAAAFAAAFLAYAPALHGPFLFDDTILPFALPSVAAPLSVWLRGVRPALMFTYWVNARLSGEDTLSYHVVNVLIHLAATGLVFLIVRKLLEWARSEAPRTVLAGFAAGLFLLHPVQTESVAYLAGRSEALSTMLVLAAFTVFLYRPAPAISWARTVAIMLLFGTALLSKEHAVAFLGLLLLTDFWWNPGFSFQGIRANWRLYVPAAAAAAGGVYYFLPMILHATTAGFGMKDLPWYQYFFTQCRALFVYLGLFVAPVRLTVDWDFPISRTLLDHGAIVGLILLAAMVAGAWLGRRRFPLAAYGFFVFLVLMAPTSSVLPIRDPIAERRLYFAMIGLLLVVVDLLGRVKLDRRTLAAICGGIVLVAGIGTFARAAVWGDAVTLWEDTAAKSPNKPRVHFQLGYAYYERGDLNRAVEEFGKTAKLEPPTHNLLIDWALAYDGLSQPDLAIAKLRQAAALEATAHVYSQIAMVYAKRQRWTEAMEALATAEKLDPRFAMTYVYRGGIKLATKDTAGAIDDFRLALQINPSLRQASQGLAVAQRRQRLGQ